MDLVYLDHSRYFLLSILTESILEAPKKKALLIIKMKKI
jgi:hypothetical protein